MKIVGDPSVDKERWRQDFKTRLAGLDADFARRSADRLAATVLGLPEIDAARHIFACLSFGAEIDTRRLIERLLASGRRVYVPRASAAPSGDRRLHVHPFPCELRTLSFGLDQPIRNAPQLPAAEIDATLDAALILGLGFDRRGFRLGYGGGYFDRFLAGRQFPKIGLAYDLQVVDALPVEPHDVPMSMVVTENGVRRF